MSNCINSGIRKIFILTQFNSFSLNRHLSRTYNFGNGVNFGDGFVEVIPLHPIRLDISLLWYLQLKRFPLGKIRFLLQLKLPEMQERNGFRELLMPLGSLYGSSRCSFFVLLFSHSKCFLLVHGGDITLMVLMQDAKTKNVEHVLILSGDHLYRMDYMNFVQVSFMLLVYLSTLSFM